MPRRGAEIIQVLEPPKKKNKGLIEETTSLDVSFFDDEALAPGLIFTDIQLKKWRIGKPIGRGSFGRIYLASDDIEKDVTKANARYVVKIEPHTNGPLFVEIHCLIRTALISKVKEWRMQNKQKRIGMPVYVASGSFIDENTGIKYRFLVLPRYDIDLQKIIARTKILDLKNVLVLAIQILDVLEYLHNHGYTHSDIKSSNLMLGFNGMKLSKVQLIKLTPSFQKDTNQVSVLSGKLRRAKSGKTRYSNYYDDEDFIVKDYKNSNESNEEDNKESKLANVKNKLRKILSDKDNRQLHRNHAFNLRQLSNYVNYEDMTSSVCSDQSYQKLLDDFGNKIQYDFFEDSKPSNDNQSSFCNTNDIYKEVIMSQSNGQIYLLDYGLASKFVDSNGKHKEFCMDARKAHDGTLEYSSRDSHIGAHSRRSDLETVGYNLLDWLTGTLPWKTVEVLTEPELVHALKKNFMANIKSLLKTCFKTEFYPQFIEKYLQYVVSLDYNEKPDYDYCRSLFKSELLRNGWNKDEPLNFDATISLNNHKKTAYTNKFGRKNTPANFIARNGIKKAYERENVCSFENDLKLELLKQTLNLSNDGIRKPCTSRNFFISDADLIVRLKKSLMSHDIFGKKLSPKNLRSNNKNVKKKRGRRGHRNSIGKFGNFMGSARQFTWAEILAGNPEDIIRKERRISEDKYVDDDDDDDCKYRIRKLSNASENSDTSAQSPLLQKDYLKEMNPTYAMKEVIANLKKKVSRKGFKETEDNGPEIAGYTPVMMKYYKIKQKREAKEKLETINHQNNEKHKQSNDKEEMKTMCTRSLRSKRGKTREPLPSPPPRVTRKKTSSVDSIDKSKKAVTKSSHAIDLDVVESKSNSRRKIRSTTSDHTKQKVEEEKTPITTTMAKAKSSPRTRTTSHTVPNRRRLRSSKRKK